MDLNDRQDGNKDTNENTEPTQHSDTISSTQAAEPNADAGFESMRHQTTGINTLSVDPDIEPAEIGTTEAATVASEVEPSTAAFTQEGPQPPEASSDLSTAEQKNTGFDAPVIAPTGAATSMSAHTGNKKHLLLAIVCSVLLFVVIGVIAWWMLMGNNEPSGTAEDTLSSATEQTKLGVAFTVIDGTVTFSSDMESWQPATTDSQPKEGDSIRTGADGRAVLALDDGSAVRLDANTIVTLESLLANAVMINQTGGSVYSRVVPSDRSYVVKIDETTYKALGTAFMTHKNTTNTGVQVFQSSVESSDLDEAIPEGKQHLKPFGDYVGEIAVSDIDIDAALDNSFLNWNLNQDESDANFKQRLGILSQIKERAAERIAELQALEEQKAAAERALKEKIEAERIEKEKAHDSSGKVTRGTMTLSSSDRNRGLSWTYTGKAVHGYKLVYSKESSTPTFGADEARYYGNIHETSDQLPKISKHGNERYYARVCAYTAGTDDEKCVDYSNVVVIYM